MRRLVSAHSMIPPARAQLPISLGLGDSLGSGPRPFRPAQCQYCDLEAILFVGPKHPLGLFDHTPLPGLDPPGPRGATLALSCLFVTFKCTWMSFIPPEKRGTGQCGASLSQPREDHSVVASSSHTSCLRFCLNLGFQMRSFSRIRNTSGRGP